MFVKVSTLLPMEVPLHCEEDLGSGMEGLEHQDLWENKLPGLALDMDAWGEPKDDFFSVPRDLAYP